LKIALITSSTPFGPGESFVVVEANALAKEGVDVMLVPTQLRYSKLRNLYLHPNIVLKACGLFSIEVWATFIMEFIAHPIQLFKVSLQLLSAKPVIIVKNFLVFPKAVWLAKLVKGMGVEHIHAHWASTPSTVAMIASQISTVPWSFTAHRGDIVESNMLCEKLESAAFSRFISNKSITLAENICDHLSATAILLHLGVSLPKVSFKPCTEEKFVILCPANLIAVKGHQYLIEAISYLVKKEEKGGIELWLAGSGPMKQELEALVVNLELEQVISFLGEVDHRDLLRMYEDSVVHLVVLPSLDMGRGMHEGIPVSLMEAMAYFIPVIATTTGGIPELLGAGAGISVPQRSSTELAEAIHKLRTDAGYYKQIAFLGRQRIFEKFNLDRVVKMLLALINDNLK